MSLFYNFVTIPTIFTSNTSMKSLKVCNSNKITIKNSAANFSFDTSPLSLPTPLSQPQSSPSSSSTNSKRSTSSIELFASDLDGTFLNSSKQPCARNIAAVFAAIKSGIQFIPATGKSRIGALRALGPLGKYLLHIDSERCPGIFLNGLCVYGKNGKIIFERSLSNLAAKNILLQAEMRGLIVLFYLGDQVMVRKRTKETDMFIISHEPIPTAIGDLEKIINEENTIHKALLVDPKGQVKKYRKELEDVLKGFAEITQARPDVLEVVPVGSSKGEGFQVLLEDLQIDAKNTMAIGDGENDIEMIKQAGIGIAVSNAVPEMLSQADFVVGDHNDAAVAQAVDQFIFT